MTEQTEQWRPIAGFRGYEVSNQGRIRSYLTSLGALAQLRREPRLRRTKVDKHGIEWVELASPTGSVQRVVSALVEQAFPKPEVPV